MSEYPAADAIEELILAPAMARGVAGRKAIDALIAAPAVEFEAAIEALCRTLPRLCALKPVLVELRAQRETRDERAPMTEPPVG